MVEKVVLSVLIGIAFLGIIGFASQEAFAGTLYAIYGDRLHSIDSDSFFITDIGSLGTDEARAGLAYDPNADVLYSLGVRDVLNLYRIDQTTGTATLIGYHGVYDLSGLAFDFKNNILYATSSPHVLSGETQALYTLNTNTGQATLVGETSSTNTGMDGLAYDSLNDRLIATQAGGFSSTIYEINKNTGETTLLNNIPRLGSSGLTYDPFKNIFWSTNMDGMLRSYDPDNNFAIINSIRLPYGYPSLAFLTTPGANALPTISIISPSDNTVIIEGDLLQFSGTAIDLEDGDITNDISWNSDIDGLIGTGGSFSTVLSVGTHLITASVDDSSGQTSYGSFTVIVEFPDLDNDGFKSNIDCNDNDSSVFPGAPEVGGDGIDQDCDGFNNEGAPPITCADGTILNTDTNKCEVDPTLTQQITDLQTELQHLWDILLSGETEVCHKDKTQTISIASIGTHLSHGDTLGACEE